MDHHMHHHAPPLHWGYSGTPPSSHAAVHNTWVPPPSRSLKRSISESDCDDNYSETSSKEWVSIIIIHVVFFVVVENHRRGRVPYRSLCNIVQCWFFILNRHNNSCEVRTNRKKYFSPFIFFSSSNNFHFSFSSVHSTSPKDNDSCQHLSRKKRRGVIEKKRRDRINSSLSELKRLVPSAYEKQGSSKLEKAEILQLTVDHLKTLHSKGMLLYKFDLSLRIFRDFFTDKLVHIHISDSFASHRPQCIIWLIEQYAFNVLQPVLNTVI